MCGFLQSKAIITNKILSIYEIVFIITKIIKIGMETSIMLRSVILKSSGLAGLFGLLCIGVISPVFAQSTTAAAPTFVPSASRGITPNIEGQIGTALRYRPDGSDFIIENGSEFFNRALYGGHTAFRVDAGDKPEFSLYLPGRGGNVRIGIKTDKGIIWLQNSSKIISRYRPGEMHYNITDPILGSKASIELIGIADPNSEALLLRVISKNIASNAKLIFAYGGGNGERGRRDGDIGTEKVPISEYFQFKPEFAKDNQYKIKDQVNKGFKFTADTKSIGITGTSSVKANFEIIDAENWNKINNWDIVNSKNNKSENPKIIIAEMPINKNPIFLSFQVTLKGSAEELADYRNVTAGQTNSPKQANINLPDYRPEELKQKFDNAQFHFKALRNQVKIETPDTYLNAAVGSLNVAADALWDERDGGGIMHGAIAWRARLLGWRGPYALDALGWHDRARQNFGVWTKKQNLKPIPPNIPPAEIATNLARNPDGLHSNGDLSNTHYDMNIGFFDAMFRHLLWTGDIAYAREVWPVIQRHLAWEKRLFRREFGPEKLPLYEAYAAIWASDDVQYHGGGVGYTSAYNIYHNRMAARIAKMIGEDARPFEQEAELIERGMKTYLWMPERGTFAEFRDSLGYQNLHPSYGLWNFYHIIDSGAVNEFEAVTMSQDLERHLKPIPIYGKGVPSDRPYQMYPSSDWMPYSWSVNNIVMGENMHTSLALWQAGRNEKAYNILRGGMLASFYMGIAPGNVGSMNYLDVYRRESQRDFADGAGVMSRALIEGLFGIRPDALKGKIAFVPGFPSEWDHASINHPNVNFQYKRQGTLDVWKFSQTDKKFSNFSIDIPARYSQIESVTINNKPATWSALKSIDAPKLRIESSFTNAIEIKVKFKGEAINEARANTKPHNDKNYFDFKQGDFEWWGPKQQTEAPKTCKISAPVWTKQTEKLNITTLNISEHFNDKLTDIFRVGKYVSPRSKAVSLAMPSQGIGAWAGHVNAKANIDDSALRNSEGSISILNGLKFLTPNGDNKNIAFVSHWDNYNKALNIPLKGSASRAFLMMAGSTNHMQSRIENAEVIVTYTDGTTERLALRNPENWWPIERDYFIDDYQFRLCGTAPLRLDLKTGKLHNPAEKAKGDRSRETIDGGSANILAIDLNPNKTLQSLKLHALANEVVIGLMGISLQDYKE